MAENKWLTVLITLVIGVINPVITGRGAHLVLCHQHFPNFPVFYVPSSFSLQLSQMFDDATDGRIHENGNIYPTFTHSKNQLNVYLNTPVSWILWDIRSDSDGKSLHKTTISVPLGCPHDTLFARSVSRRVDRPASRVLGEIGLGVAIPPFVVDNVKGKNRSKNRTKFLVKLLKMWRGEKNWRNCLSSFELLP